MLLPPESRSMYTATTRSNEELTELIENRQNYMPETVEASIAELQSRGHEFSDEELKIFSEDLQALRENAALVGNIKGVFNKEYKNVIVLDPDAPLLYSRIAINTFTIFMGALFGSVMMSINLTKFGKNREALWVVLFGTGFTMIQYLALSHITGSSSSMQVVFGFISAFLLDLLFWKPFIGYATFYRKRQIWTPLIIAIILASLIIASIILAPQS